MPKKIRFETDEDTSDESEELIPVSEVRFPQPKTARDQIRTIQDLMRESDEEPKPLFKRKGIIADTRKGIRGVGVPASKKKSDSKKDVSKNKKPTRKF